MSDIKEGCCDHTIFVASVTHYVDDYKLRGRDPSTTWGPTIFPTKEEAHNWVATTLWNYFDDWDYFTVTDLEQAFLKVTDFEEVHPGEYRIAENDKLNYALLTSIADSPLVEGQFAPRCITYTVREHTVSFPSSPQRKRAKKIDH